MTGIIIVALLNLAFGVWVARLIVRDPANLRKFRKRPGNPDEPPAS